MPDPTYGDTGAVVRNVKALFPDGLDATTVPSGADVAAQMAVFQAKVRQILKVKLGKTNLPAANTDAHLVASSTVESGTTAWVVAVALASRGEEGAAVVRRWETMYQDGLRQLREMQKELDETPEHEERLRFDDPTQRRDGRWIDEQLAGSEPAW